MTTERSDALQTIPSLLTGKDTSRREIWQRAMSSPYCLHCKGPKSNNRKVPRVFCSIACRNAWGIARNTHTCENCGSPFYRVRSHARRAKNLLCSHKCHGEFQSGAGNKMWGGGSIRKNCARCGSAFSCGKKESTRRTYCSLQCRTAAYWEPRKRPNIMCVACGVSFKPRNKNSKYCSIKCKNDAQSKNISGANNGRYVHGQHERPYPPGWTKTHRQQIRARDGDKCRVCGMRQEDHGKLLCVHHIDYDKDNLQPPNLITCCRFCHGKMHGRPAERVKWKRKLSALLGA